MPTVVIEEKGCRGCRMCVDVCPVEVFELEARDGVEVARVVRTEDCIGCFSCYYQCPSQCIEIPDAEMQRPFHRIEENVAFVEKFLQCSATATALTREDWDEAYTDVSMTILSLSRSSARLMGRGMRALGRKSGNVAAEHLPEIYEASELSEVLRRLQHRFQHCFDLDFSVDGDDVDLTLTSCVLHEIVTKAGEVVGEAISCQLFHDYLAGLLSAYSGENFRCSVKSVGGQCKLGLSRG